MSDNPTSVHQPSPFVPPGLDCTSWLALEPFYTALTHRPVQSESEFWEWLREYSELSDAVGESYERSSIRHTCHTDDPKVEREFMHIVQQIEPHVAALHFELQKKFLADVDTTGVRGDPRIAPLARRWQADVDAYREQNIPLQVRDTMLAVPVGRSGDRRSHECAGVCATGHAERDCRHFYLRADRNDNRVRRVHDARGDW